MATFDNPEIPTITLPTADDLDWQPLHERYVRELQTRQGLVTGLVAAVCLIAAITPLRQVFSPLWFLPPLALLALLMIAWPAIAVPRCGYVLRDKDIVYRSGVFKHTVTAVPFNRIQHVETSNTPLDRRFGTGTLELYTAGGSSGDLKIHGLPAETAERLRDHVLRKIGANVERD